MAELALLDVQAGIATLTLNRPEKRNAMDDGTRTALGKEGAKRRGANARAAGNGARSMIMFEHAAGAA